MKKLLIAALALGGLALIATVPATPTTAGDAPDAEATAALYGKKCAMCHGKDGVAKKMGEGSGNFNDPAWKKGISKEAVVKVTAEGKGKMPKYDGKLSPEEIDALADYVLAM